MSLFIQSLSRPGIYYEHQNDTGKLRLALNLLETKEAKGFFIPETRPTLQEYLTLDEKRSISAIIQGHVLGRAAGTRQRDWQTAIQILDERTVSL